MYKKILSLCFFLAPLLARAQDVVDKPATKPHRAFTLTRGVMLGFGIAGTSFNTGKFDLWATRYGAMKVQYPLHLTGMMIVQFNKIDFGAQLSSGHQFALANFLAGYQVYNRGRYTSLAEFSCATLRTDYKDIVPPGFSLTDERTGSQNYLRGKSFLLGLTTRHVFTWVNKDGYDMAHVGVFGTVNYRPGNVRWEYGYDEKGYNDDGDAYTHFTGQRVHDAPAYGRFLFSIGCYVGLGGPLTRSYPRMLGGRNGG